MAGKDKLIASLLQPAAPPRSGPLIQPLGNDDDDLEKETAKDKAPASVFNTATAAAEGPSLLEQMMALQAEAKKEQEKEKEKETKKKDASFGSGFKKGFFVIRFGC